MNKLRTKLNDMGIADTRQFYIEDALASCHRAFSPLDTHNRALVIEHMPFLAQCAKWYGMNSVACNTFEHDEILMPEQLDKLILDLKVKAAQV